MKTQTMICAALLLLGVTSTAQAVPYCSSIMHPKEYPGSACKGRGYQGSDDKLAYTSTNTTGVKNTSTSNWGASCPLVRFAGDSNYGGIYSAWLLVTGQSWAPTDASFLATSYDGKTSYAAATPSVTYDTPTGTTTFVWPDKIFAAYANYAIAVTVRPGQTIKSYELNECNYFYDY